MTNEEIRKYLKKIATSTEGVALKEYIENQISKMLDPRRYSEDNFEMDGKTSLKAAYVLEKLLVDLELLKKPVNKPSKNQYQ